jgi:hypothetical protein
MVILRELGESSRFPPLYSDLERQIRSHFTRADDSLDKKGFYSEIFGSGFSDSSLERDSDSDCLIIPRSSFT